MCCSAERPPNSGAAFGCNPLRQTLGLGRAERVERLQVLWPATGRVELLTDVAADQTIEIEEE